MVWKGIGIAAPLSMFTPKSVLFSKAVEVYLHDLYFTAMSDGILEVFMDFF